MAAPAFVTVTPNCAVDRTVVAPGFRVGRHVKATVVGRTAAGKGVNVSGVLSALGVSSTATGMVGADCLEMFQSRLEACGGRSEFVAVDAPTRISTTILDPLAGTDTHLRECGPRVRPETVRALEEVTVRLARRARFVAICGSLPPGYSLRALVGLAAAAGDAGARVAVDAEGRVLRRLRRRNVFLAAPNVLELSQLVGSKLSSEKAVLTAIRRERGAFRNLLVSWGVRGAFLGCPEGVFRARLDVHVDARNTVGCGDALLAGYLAALLRNMAPMRALQEAVAVAGAAARTPTAGTLHLTALRQYRAKVKVQSA